MKNQHLVEYATFNRRLIAACIDLFIIVIIFTPFLSVFDNFIYNGRSPSLILQECLTESTVQGSTVDVNIFLDKLNREKLWHKILATHSIVFLIIGIYEIGFWYKWGATPGKFFIGCKILTADKLRSPHITKLFIRYIFYITAFIPLALFTKKNQGLHDKIAGTVVIVIRQNFKWLHKIGITRKE